MILTSFAANQNKSNVAKPSGDPNGKLVEYFMHASFGMPVCRRVPSQKVFSKQNNSRRRMRSSLETTNPQYQVLGELAIASLVFQIYENSH
jgi:hypothetical protein